MKLYIKPTSDSFVNTIVNVLLYSIIIVLFTTMFSSNNYDQYKVRQGFLSGKMSVINEAGIYFSGLDKVTNYEVSDDISFEDYDVEVRFSDGAVVGVKGTVKYKMPTNPEKQLLIHKDFASNKSVVIDLVVKNVKEALSQTATLHANTPDDAINRLETMILMNDMEIPVSAIRHYIDNAIDIIIQIDRLSDGKRKVTSIVYKEGKPVIRKETLLKKYGIEVLQFVVNDFTFDVDIQKLINQKKIKEQEKVISWSEAEKAKAEAITEAEKGKARIAKAEADAEVEKKTAVVAAQEKAEVAKLEAQQAEYEAKAIKIKGESEAYANKLKVQAGLTPLEKANIEKEISRLKGKTIKTNNKGQAKIILPYGKYIIKQLTTTEGYQKIDPITINVDNSEKEKITLKNYKINVPNTKTSIIDFILFLFSEIRIFDLTTLSISL